MLIKTFPIYALTTLGLFLLFNSFGHSEVKHMKHLGNSESTELASMEIDGVNAFIKDIVFSNDPVSPITCGLFRMEKGKELQFTFDYDEASIILEGQMTMAEKDGETIVAKTGDVLYLEEGADITYTSNSSALVFYCGQRP
jgi:ethanolamine utilization protein EutQ (cupin superfamily)